MTYQEDSETCGMTRKSENQWKIVWAFKCKLHYKKPLHCIDIVHQAHVGHIDMEQQAISMYWNKIESLLFQSIAFLQLFCCARDGFVLCKMSCFVKRPIDNYAKDGGSEVVYLLCSFYHDPLRP